MATRALRRIRLRDRAFRWRVYHAHRTPEEACAEVFAAWMEGFPRAPLRLFFREGPLHGPAFPRLSGLVVDDREPRWSALLHRPKNAAVLMELGLARGWWPPDNPRREVEIADMFELVRSDPALRLKLSEEDERRD